MIRLPNFPRLTQLQNRILSFIGDYKILIIISFAVTASLIVFGTAAMRFKDYLQSEVKKIQQDNSKSSYAITPDVPDPNLQISSPSADIVLGTSDDSGSNDNEDNVVLPTLTPFPTITPYPLPTSVPYTAPTTTNTNSTGNPNCTTGAGTPNLWYSDVYVSPASAVVGSALTFSVDIRDCNQNDVSNDSLKISLSSGDNSVQINGNNLPYTIQTQNGKATFTMTSSNSGTYTFVIQDTSKNFSVTDTNNHNPSVTFTNNTSGNSNCTTAAGVSNAWYSDVYPASPVTVNLGSSAGFTVDIRDCNRNNVSNDTLQISLSSGDNSVQINGNNLPYTIQVQNGEVSFSVTSSNAGTYGFTVRDTSSGFDVTDPNNHNPSVVFNNPSAPTPQPTSPPTTSDTPTPAPTNTPTSAPTDTLTPAATSSGTPH